MNSQEGQNSNEKIPLKKTKTNQKPADWFCQMWKYSTNYPTPVANKKADNRSFKDQSTKLCVTKGIFQYFLHVPCLLIYLLKYWRTCELAFCHRASAKNSSVVLESLSCMPTECFRARCPDPFSSTDTNNEKWPLSYNTIFSFSPPSIPIKATLFTQTQTHTHKHTITTVLSAHAMLTEKVTANLGPY